MSGGSPGVEGEKATGCRKTGTMVSIFAKSMVKTA